MPPHPDLGTMRLVLLEVLACPVCKHHPLGLTIVKEDLEGVVEGTLSCPRCGTEYPITDSIPDMIPPRDK